MGVGAVPWSIINAYASRYGIANAENFESFAMLIRAADAAYLEVVSKKT